MRVLCTLTGTPSHARAMLPLVRALADAGHDLLVVAPPRPAKVFAGEDVRTAPVLPELADQVMGALRDGTVALPADLDLFDQRLWVLTGCGPHVVDNYRTVLPIAEEFAPDLVLRDGTDMAGFLVAETLGAVHVPAPSGTGQFLDADAVTEALAAHRVTLGLAPDDDPGALYRHGRLDCVPASLSFARPGAPDAFAYQQPPTVTRGETLPAWIAELPADKPLVLAASGTLLTGFTPEEGTLPDAATENPLSIVPEAYIAGLSQLDCTAVVATGGIPVDPGLAAGHVHVVDHFPQPLLLQCADLFATHGGYNSVREALRSGVPMAVLPLFGDQMHNAERVTGLGLGLRVEEAEADEVAKTCARVLEDTDTAVRARTAQRHMLTLPPVEAAVDHLEGLVG
ncbi:glycosyltransferase [Streptomyces sp. NPDC004539]|uniref:glycosyltransferase n=1 Tax=Streptomyces sp. NPDC004539 TaxID=3154280 RepID=UPI0033B660E8